MLIKKRKRKKEIMPPMLTIFLTLMIIVMAGAIRVRVKADRVVIPADEGSIKYQDTEPYIKEIQDIAMLLYGRQGLSGQSKEEGTFVIYTDCLKEYLNNPDLKISADTYGLMKEKVIELIDVMNIEHESDFTKMSLDGRAVAVDIAGQIYKFCGLELITNIDGDILQIRDRNGRAIYRKDNPIADYNFQTYAFIISLSILFLLFGLVLLVVKKNNLFQKEVSYDEFDEKRFA